MNMLKNRFNKGRRRSLLRLNALYVDHQDNLLKGSVQIHISNGRYVTNLHLLWLLIKTIDTGVSFSIYSWGSVPFNILFHFPLTNFQWFFKSNKKLDKQRRRHKRQIIWAIKINKVKICLYRYAIIYEYIWQN